MENGKGEWGVSSIFSLHSPLRAVYRRRPTGRLCGSSKQAGGRGRKNAEGKIYILSPNPPPFSPSPPFPFDVQHCIFCTRRYNSQCKIFIRGPNLRHRPHTCAGPPCLPSFFKQTEIRTKLKEWQLKSHKRRNLASGP